MKNLFFIILLMIFTAACQNNEEEYDRELIIGEYTGELIYWNSIVGTGSNMISTDPSKGWEFKTTIKKAGTNYVLSFDQSFNYKIPDITVEINPTKTLNFYEITSLPGQSFYIPFNWNTYSNVTGNFLFIEKYPQVINCNFNLKSMHPDSTNFLDIRINRIY